MEQFSGTGKILIIAGGCLILAGLVITFAGKIPYLGKLPGDFFVQKKNFSFFFPLTTSILLSLLLSLILYLFRKF